jgi:nitric oxide reductase subunit B
VSQRWSSGRTPPSPREKWVALVVLFGFFVLGLLAYRTYVAGPPIPDAVVAEDGAVVFSGEDVKQGQRIFLRVGLMEFGSVFGHGAYLGPDFTADYLRRSAVSVTETYEHAGERNVAAHVVSDFKTNRYDPTSGTLSFTAAQAHAFAIAERHYAEFFARPATETGGRMKGLSGPAALHALTSFFAWTAWVASAERPGKSYSYTNNWPPEPLVRNQPPPQHSSPA